MISTVKFREPSLTALMTWKPCSLARNMTDQVCCGLCTQLFSTPPTSAPATPPSPARILLDRKYLVLSLKIFINIVPRQSSPCHHLMPFPVSALMLSLLRLAWLMAAVLLLLLLLL